MRPRPSPSRHTALAVAVPRRDSQDAEVVVLPLRQPTPEVEDTVQLGSPEGAGAITAVLLASLLMLLLLVATGGTLPLS